MCQSDELAYCSRWQMVPDVCYLDVWAGLTNFGYLRFSVSVKIACILDHLLIKVVEGTLLLFFS